MHKTLIDGNPLAGNTTSSVIIFDDVVQSSATVEEAVPLFKRAYNFSEVVLASSLMILTAPALSFPDPRLSEVTYSSIAKEPELGITKKRQITLQEARQIALRAHYSFENGLREDRIQEARLMAIGAAFDQDS
jgi:hypoxanthine phosphoribosyltransferase